MQLHSNSTAGPDQTGMRTFRILLIVFCVIWLLPAPLLFGRTVESSTLVLGRYAPKYFIALILYALVLVIALAAAVLAKPRLIAKSLILVRWLQRFPVLIAVVLYGLVEAWYLVRRYLLQARDFGIGSEFVFLLVVTALLELYFAGILIFAGREPQALRTTITNSLLALVSGTLTFLLICWVYASLQGGTYQAYHRHWKLHESDAQLGYKGRPDRDHYALNLDPNDLSQDIYVTTDQNGFRNNGDVTGAPVAGIGDSFLFGLNLPDQDLWSVRLSEQLGVPVANYGISGYQIWQYNLVAERYVAPSDHQLVIYGIFANDLGNDIEVEENPRLLQRWELRPYQSPVNFTIFTLLNESPIYKISQGLKGKNQGSDQNEAPPPQTDDQPPTCDTLALNYTSQVEIVLKQRLDRAIEISEAGEYTLAFVLIPSKLSVYREQFIPYCPVEGALSLEREQAGYQTICDYLEARDIHCYDMTDDFRAQANASTQALYSQTDFHWNANGSRLFADLLAAYINDNQLLEP